MEIGWLWFCGWWHSLAESQRHSKRDGIAEMKLTMISNWGPLILFSSQLEFTSGIVCFLTKTQHLGLFLTKLHDDRLSGSYTFQARSDPDCRLIQTLSITWWCDSFSSSKLQIFFEEKDFEDSAFSW